MVFGLDDALLGIMAGSSIAGAVGGFMGPGASGLSREDQRWLADFNWHQSLRNEQFQHDLATSGIQMRVDDAVKAGLSPLVGAGVAPYSGGVATPVFGGSGSEADKGAGWRNFGQMGQDLSRSLMAMKGKEDRKMFDVNLRKAQAEADIAESQAASSKLSLLNRSQVPPGLPGTRENPIPSALWYKSPSGQVYMAPSPEAAQSSHGELFGKALWDLRNVGPNFFRGALQAAE